MKSASVSEIERLMETEKPLRAVLKAYRNFTEFQEPFLAEAPVEAGTLTPDEAREMAADGKVLLQHDAASLDLDWAASHAERLAVFFEGLNPGKWERILEFVRNEKDSLKRAFLAFLSDDVEAVSKLAPGGGKNLALNVSLLQLAMKPQLLALGEKLSPAYDRNAWSSGYCPVCGALPAMSEKTVPGGRWILYCPNCETSYRRNLGACPFCGNASERDVKFFATSRKGLGFMGCGACKGYIKIVDRGGATDFPAFPLSDVASLEVDLLAAKKGYRKMTVGVFGV